MATVGEVFALALQHQRAGNLREAEQLYRQVLQADPNHADSYHLLGMIAHAHGKHQEAVELIRRALAFRPDSAEIYCNLAVALMELGSLGDAANFYQRALQLSPQMAEAHNGLGCVCHRRNMLLEAVRRYKKAAELKPDFAPALRNLANIFKPLTDLAASFLAKGKLDQAEVYYRHALEAQPDSIPVLILLSNVLVSRGKLDDAIASYRRVLALEQHHVAVLSGLVHQLQQTCQWDGLDKFTEQILVIVRSGGGDGSHGLVPPYAVMGLPTSTARDQHECAMRWASDVVKNAMKTGRQIHGKGSRRGNSKLTVGYLSTDFREHAIAYLAAELFEQHNRERFNVIGYSYGNDDASPMRQRLMKGFDRFVDIERVSSMEAAECIASDGVDILVDLTGYQGNARTEILACRPAPIQVNYLFPGTMGAEFMDYIIVDDFLVPSDQQPFFLEKLVHMPGCYLVNDGKRPSSPWTPTRQECGLPENGLVLCCFNANFKITPAVFGVWMDLLNAVPGSILWLFEGNRFAPANLRREAAARGVAPERLVFAPQLPLADHLARHRLADLFLDTFPYNAHTTACDAFWVGCPVLTLTGETFVSRVAGTLLRALDLGELITTSLDEYRSKALLLAQDADYLAAIRARLHANRDTSHVFDAKHFAQGLETAFEKMWDIYQSGEKPRPFAVM